MSATLSPRQVESVEHWLDDQPNLNKEAGHPFGRNSPGGRAPAPFHCRNGQPHDRHLHVHSRLRQHSRLTDHEYATDALIDPIECFLRVASACLGSAILGVSAVTLLLARATSPPAAGSLLDVRLNWVMGLPVASLAVFWQLTRLGLLAWHDPDRSNCLLAVDVLLESLLGVGASICAVLTGFQAARHRTYNAHHKSAADPVNIRTAYRDVGPEIALVVLLGLLTVSSFGILTLSFVEVSRRRKRVCHSTSSSVIEIIS
ncbi:hypothetical protein SPI_06005 [Niveomyces insectorum RCEF 264]|uniref:Uncharacterized protein n=1 Tax=Niveomyces insectorum RCEF 264 TaxID=1081102 RepID=A0A167SPD1_9HYPO|nr:hypothetical protein SPI_06005 [Niveomyces insectorum RCEF 264]